MNIKIRPENVNDYKTVEKLTREAFWNLYVPGCSEHFVLHNMRKHTDFVPELDLVAELDGEIAGNIVYTRGVIENNQGIKTIVLGFGPLSVLPSLQKRGIGSALVNYSLNIARLMSYPALFVYGDPRYYSRFGFRCAERYDFQTSDGKYAWALLALELQPGGFNNLKGRYIESSAFSVDENQLAEFERAFPHKEKLGTDSQRTFQMMVGLRY